MKTPYAFCSVLELLSVLPGSAAKAQRSEPIYSADSVVLERTLCFGTCPAYRLSISRSGVIYFEWRNPQDERRARDSIPVSDFETIVVQADLVDFLSLPDSIADDRRFCPHDF